MRQLTGATSRVGSPNGRETVYIVSAKTYHKLKQAQRETIATADLTDAELALIEAAEIPAKHRYAIGE